MRIFFLNLWGFSRIPSPKSEGSRLWSNAFKKHKKITMHSYHQICCMTILQKIKNWNILYSENGNMLLHLFCQYSFTKWYDMRWSFWMQTTPRLKSFTAKLKSFKPACLWWERSGTCMKLTWVKLAPSCDIKCNFQLHNVVPLLALSCCCRFN